mmetsp:Transcript_4674/g.29506  ORF Transcript_4674/g.29506 Transcript_4674/m.29506 type:complete len:200 (-) Transcript_4674:1805-2404(-)
MPKLSCGTGTRKRTVWPKKTTRKPTGASKPPKQENCRWHLANQNVAKCGGSSFPTSIKHCSTESHLSEERFVRPWNQIHFKRTKRRPKCDLTSNWNGIRRKTKMKTPARVVVGNASTQLWKGSSKGKIQAQMRPSSRNPTSIELDSWCGSWTNTTKANRAFSWANFSSLLWHSYSGNLSSLSSTGKTSSRWYSIAIRSL